MPFLTARWESLLLLNYACPADLLAPLVPAETELDLWQGEALVSVVGFLFRDTRLRGVPVPYHRNFEEVNLRFYVRREVEGEVRRAVTFVREIVPRRAIATVARVVYNEPYVAAPMRHSVRLDAEAGGTVDYGWPRGPPSPVLTYDRTFGLPLCPLARDRSPLVRHPAGRVAGAPRRRMARRSRVAGGSGPSRGSAPGRDHRR